LKRAFTKSVVEGLIFAHSDPITADSLRRLIPEVSGKDLQEILDELETEYRERSRGFLLVEVGGGYQFRTLPEVAPWILTMKSVKPARLSRASLETLSIIAYNQPMTKSAIERIRGVEASSSIKNLLERDLIAVTGKLDAPGRPLLYGTSERFLEVFGLKSLFDLPPLPDPEVIGDDAV